jgi:uncharacterized protein (TIGR00725 family)
MTQPLTLNNQEPKYYYNGPLENSEKHGHLRVKIGVSGAAETGHCGLHALEKAQELGKEIIRQGGIYISGATTGFPLWGAMGAKEENGISIGLSPAESEEEHLKTYRLPVDYMDLIIYTGFGFPGRDLLFTRSCDAIILGCGRIGTIHEFTIAFEDGKPIGILEGPWATAEDIKTLIKNGNRPADHVIFDDDPKRLVQKIMEMVEARKKQLKAA